jgi:VanZ family protein
MLKIIDWLILTCFCGLIYWLSNQSSLPDIQVVEWQDKVHHMTAYGVMSVCAWRAFRHHIQSPRLLALAAAFFCSLYGISDEFHQSFVPGRSVEVADWLADTSGAVLAQLALFRLHRRNNPLPS